MLRIVRRAGPADTARAALAASGRRGRGRLAVGLLCVTAILPMTVGTPAQAAPPPAVSAPSLAPGTLDPEKLRVMDEINSALEQDPDHFAGTSTDGPSRIMIYLVGDAESNRLDVTPALRQAETAGIQTVVQYRKYSLRELRTLKESIPGVEPFASLGDGLLSWGVDPRSNSVRVGVAEVTPELVGEVRAAFGDMVTLEEDELTTLTGSACCTTSATDTGRYWNRPNYIAGNRIRVGGRSCTSGFTIANAHGQKYALTAGHCFALGAEPVLWESNHFFGTVQFRRFNESHAKMDMELVGVDVYRGRMWIGGVQTWDALPVQGSGNSCRGCQVYFNGSFTGQSLGTIVSEGNAETCRDYQHPDIPGVMVNICHLVDVVSSNGQVLCQPGDSGGPVFAHNGRGGVTAIGIITAGDGTTCTYTRIVPILWYWQATIATEAV